MAAGTHERAKARTQSTPDRDADSRAPEVTTKVAHTIEELMQAFAVRAAVFLSELAYPYQEEFDGNDFTATHFLGYVGPEPASTCRVRYFADFAKLERVAVRQAFRKTRVGIKMIESALDFCRQKGYRQVHGHCEEHLLPLWQAFGFEPINGDKFTLADHQYIEIACQLEPHPDPIAVGKNPMVMIRPEGNWDEPGVFERSATPPPADPTGGAPDDEDWSSELKKRVKRLG